MKMKRILSLIVAISMVMSIATSISASERNVEGIFRQWHFSKSAAIDPAASFTETWVVNLSLDGFPSGYFVNMNPGDDIILTLNEQPSDVPTSDWLDDDGEDYGNIIKNVATYFDPDPNCEDDCTATTYNNNLKDVDCCAYYVDFLITDVEILGRTAGVEALNPIKGLATWNGQDPLETVGQFGLTIIPQTGQTLNSGEIRVNAVRGLRALTVEVTGEIVFEDADNTVELDWLPMTDAESPFAAKFVGLDFDVDGTNDPTETGINEPGACGGSFPLTTAPTRMCNHCGREATATPAQWEAQGTRRCQEISGGTFGSAGTLAVSYDFYELEECAVPDVNTGCGVRCNGEIIQTGQAGQAGGNNCDNDTCNATRTNGSNANNRLGQQCTRRFVHWGGTPAVHATGVDNLGGLPMLVCTGKNTPGGSNPCGGDIGLVCSNTCATPNGAFGPGNCDFQVDCGGDLLSGQTVCSNSCGTPTGSQDGAGECTNQVNCAGNLTRSCTNNCGGAMGALGAGNCNNMIATSGDECDVCARVMDSSEINKITGVNYAANDMCYAPGCNGHPTPQIVQGTFRPTAATRYCTHGNANWAIESMTDWPTDEDDIKDLKKCIDVEKLIEAGCMVTCPTCKDAKSDDPSDECDACEAFCKSECVDDATCVFAGTFCRVVATGVCSNWTVSGANRCFGNTPAGTGTGPLHANRNDDLIELWVGTTDDPSTDPTGAVVRNGEIASWGANGAGRDETTYYVDGGCGVSRLCRTNSIAGWQLVCSDSCSNTGLMGLANNCDAPGCVLVCRDALCDAEIDDWFDWANGDPDFWVVNARSFLNSDDLNTIGETGGNAVCQNRISCAGTASRQVWSHTGINCNGGIGHYTTATARGVFHHHFGNRVEECAVCVDEENTATMTTKMTESTVDDRDYMDIFNADSIEGDFVQGRRHNALPRPTDRWTTCEDCGPLCNIDIFGNFTTSLASGFLGGNFSAAWNSRELGDPVGDWTAEDRTTIRNSGGLKVGVNFIDDFWADIKDDESVIVYTDITAWYAEDNDIDLIDLAVELTKENPVATLTGDTHIFNMDRATANRAFRWIFVELVNEYGERVIDNDKFFSTTIESLSYALIQDCSCAANIAKCADCGGAVRAADVCGASECKNTVCPTGGTGCGAVVPCTHTWSAWTVTTEATCDTAGEETRSCTRDNCEVVETRAIPAACKPGAFVETKAPTCTVAGEETSTCEVCEEEVVRAIPALGHAWGPWTDVGEDTQERVCTRTGCDEKQTRAITCNDCGECGCEVCFEDGECLKCGCEDCFEDGKCMAEDCRFCNPAPDCTCVKCADCDDCDADCDCDCEDCNPCEGCGTVTNCELCDKTPCECPATGFVTGGTSITVFDALEILKLLAGMDTVIKTGNNNVTAAQANQAALITPASQTRGTPDIFDALEILKMLANMPNLLTSQN
jgi:hypothetical protein